MKLTKPEYNENATDVDALEKARIHEEGETERNLVLQVELTKRSKTEQEHKTKQGDNYMYRAVWTAIAAGVAVVAIAICTGIEVETYLGVLKEKVQLEAKQVTPCPAQTVCPVVTCQPVPVK